MNSMSSRDPNVACRHCGEHFNSDDKAFAKCPKCGRMLALFPEPELVAELLEALKVTLPWLAHRSECMVLLPASEWEKRESWVAQNCCCGIAKFEALIKKAEDTLTPSNSAKEKV